MALDKTSSEADGGPSPENRGNGHSLPLRRSGRTRKRPSSHDEDGEFPNKALAASPPSPTTRRNPKRKAAREVFDVPDNLLEASLGPWKENEQSQWPSWTEVESDPAIFTAIMGLLGVKGAKIEEVLSVDEDTLATLPHPVYGLVFLYEYVGDEDSPATQADHDVWFANQTTHNACATIALLNIMMNAEGLVLGERLRKFKQDSMGLSPPLRGHMIASNDWIRMAHNSFARRLDLLNAALSLQNDVDKKRRARPPGSRRKTTGSGRDKSDTENAYHFIAFVPVGQRIWQLNGLESGPVCIGKYAEGQHWTSVMRPVLEERMMRYETERLSFSLLALCGDNLNHVRPQLVANIRRLEELEEKFGSNPEWALSRSKEADPDMIYKSTDARLAVYQLDAEDVQTLSHGEPRLSDLDECSGLSSDKLETGLELWTKWGDEQRRIRAEYDRELSLVGQEPATILGRTKDYTAAIHEWVRKLVDHGVLRKLHEEAQLHNML